MSELISNFFSDFSHFLQLVVAWYVTNIYTLEVFSVVISLILVYGIVYCVIRSNFLILQSEKWSDFLNIKNVSRRRSLRAWKHILKKIHSKDELQWKLAIMEADKILDEILKMAGYKGETMDDRLKLLTKAQLTNLDDIKNTHRVRQQISQNPDFKITQEEVSGIIKVYHQAFTELYLIE